MFKKIKIFTLFFVSTIASGAPLKLSDEPLDLKEGVPPALGVTFDDSGSMAWSWMPDSRSFDRNRASFASPDYNLIYFNPNIEYKPPVRADGTQLPNSNFNSASRDGYYPEVKGGEFISKVDLRSKYRPFRYYRPYYNNVGSHSISYARAGRAKDENRAFYYRWIGPENATLSERRTQDHNYKRYDVTEPDEMQNFANWYTYYNTRSKLARAAVSHAFVNFGPDFKVDWQQINNNRFRYKTTNMKVFDKKHRVNFFDWLFLVPANGGTPLRRATKEAGDLFMRKGTSGPYYDSKFGKEMACQQNFHIAISDGSWNWGNGITTNDDNQSWALPPIGNSPAKTYNPKDSIYSDSNTGSLADTAFFYWRKDLRPDLDNEVPIYIDDYTDKKGNPISVAPDKEWHEIDALLWNPKNDPASWQHMVNFNIGLGIEGSLNRETDLPRLRSGELNWPGISGDTCYKYEQILNTDGKVIGVKEVKRACARHICYDSSKDDPNKNQIDCSRYREPWGPVKSCENLGNSTFFDCKDRVIRYVRESEGRVDDVWHSSVNSRGEYFSARNPEELSEALNGVVSGIIKRKGRSSAGSVSSNIITSESLSYATGFDSSDWSGFVTATDINGTKLWDAGCKLTGGQCDATGKTVTASNDHNTRKIVSFNNGAMQNFDSTFAESVKDKILDSDYYRNILQNNPSEIFTATDIVNYVRGDRSQEQSKGGKFRNRRSLLADVIKSTARVIRGPSASYLDERWRDGTPEFLAAQAGNGYADYKEQNKQRNSVLLVGSNGGMLHAFDAGIQNPANGGHEHWAYVPSASLDGLSSFADPAGKHKTYVDAAPVVRDAYIQGASSGKRWTTVALGGLRNGGRLFYALDLGSNPSSEPNVLWEFTNKNDPDMGYSYNDGTIVRVGNKSSGSKETKWVALVPNGYNSDNHRSVLFAIDLETGNVLHKWDTGVGDVTNPNGMGPPVASDYLFGNDDAAGFGIDHESEFAYAGDLHGNLYRFDLRDILSGGASSKPDLIMTGSTDRPITTAPRLFAPTRTGDNIVVVFGTGKYLERSDRSRNTPKQYLFGLKDWRDDTVVKSPYNFNDSRIITQDLTTSASKRTGGEKVVTTQESWRVELPANGERMVNKVSAIPEARVFGVTTIIPAGDDPCKAGGFSWVMFLDADSGGKPSSISSIFNKGKSDGVYIDDIVLGFNILTSIGGNERSIVIDVAGDADNSIEVDISANKWKRRSWRRLEIGE